MLAHITWRLQKSPHESILAAFTTQTYVCGGNVGWGESWAENAKTVI